MDTRSLSARDICTEFIAPTLHNAAKIRIVHDKVTAIGAPPWTRSLFRAAIYRLDEVSVGQSRNAGNH